MRNKLNKLFGVEKPLIAMLHLKGNSDQDIFERAKREIEIFVEEGVDGIVVENYFGTYNHMRMALEYLQENHSNVIYGVNSLNFDYLGFKLADEFDAKFVQLDSVVGHIKPRDEISMEVFLKEQRKNSKAVLFGGVRFKYQPVLSENTVEEDLDIAKDRCDVVVVTSDATGQETDMGKIKGFKDTLGNFPLIVGAGVNENNVIEQMKVADGAIIGSALKEGLVDTGEVDRDQVKKLVNLFKEIRGERI